MKIYVGHSSSIDFREKLYRPLKESNLAEHEFVFPHEDSGEPFDSKKFLSEEADLFVAEVSEASTGLGIELGWADLFDVPVLCIHREEARPSSSLQALEADVESYSSEEELVEAVKDFVEASS